MFILIGRYFWGLEQRYGPLEQIMPASAGRHYDRDSAMEAYKLKPSASSTYLGTMKQTVFSGSTIWHT